MEHIINRFGKCSVCGRFVDQFAVTEDSSRNRRYVCVDCAHAHAQTGKDRRNDTPTKVSFTFRLALLDCDDISQARIAEYHWPVVGRNILVPEQSNLRGSRSTLYRAERTCNYKAIAIQTEIGAQIIPYLMAMGYNASEFGGEGLRVVFRHTEHNKDFCTINYFRDLIESSPRAWDKITEQYRDGKAPCQSEKRATRVAE